MSLLNDPGIIVAGSLIGDTRSGLSWTWGWIDEFVFELWIMIWAITSICPFVSSGTHLDEGWIEIVEFVVTIGRGLFVRGVR